MASVVFALAEFSKKRPSITKVMTMTGVSNMIMAWYERSTIDTTLTTTL